MGQRYRGMEPGKNMPRRAAGESHGNHRRGIVNRCRTRNEQRPPSLRMECALASEAVLARDWDTPEDGRAWARL